VEVEDVIAYRDDLVKRRRRKARTVNMKLSVVRAYFGYLKAAGDIEVNPADTKLVSVPAPPEDMAGRALTPEEVIRLLSAPDCSKVEGARDSGRTPSNRNSPSSCLLVTMTTKLS